MKVLGAVRRGKKERLSFTQLGEGLLTSLVSLQKMENMFERRGLTVRSLEFCN